jgi:hypothetical protein
MKSRKTILGIIAILAAIATAFGGSFGLEINPGVGVTYVGVALIYILFQGKSDIRKAWARIGEQMPKFKDGKFWSVIVLAAVGAADQAFGLKLPMELVNTIVAFIISIIFKVEAPRPA